MGSPQVAPEAIRIALRSGHTWTEAKLPLRERLRASQGLFHHVS